MPPPGDGDGDDTNSPFAALAELAEAFIVLVRALVEGDELTAMTPRRILDLAVECMPPGKHAALIAVQDGDARSIAANTDLPGQVDAIRLASGQGPSLDVLDTNDLVVSNDLAADPRWPLFGRRVVDELGIRSAVSYRLYAPPGDRGPPGDRRGRRHPHGHRRPDHGGRVPPAAPRQPQPAALAFRRRAPGHHARPPHRTAGRGPAVRPLTGPA